jgi:hypothetical protein
MKLTTDITNQPSKRGRKPIYATDKERAEAKRKRNSAYFSSEEYKEKRRQRYKTDKAYRKECIERALAYAAELRQSDVDAYSRLIRKNVSAIHRFSSWRSVEHRFHKRSRPRPLQTCTIQEFSELISRDVELVRAWVKSERLPKPQWVDVNDRAIKCFSSAQAVAMAELISTHLRTEKAHFLESSKKLINLLAKTKTLK